MPRRGSAAPCARGRHVDDRWGRRPGWLDRQRYSYVRVEFRPASRPDVDMALTREAVRSAIARAFTTTSPTAADLVAAALRAGARPEIVDALRDLPADDRFTTAEDVWRAIRDRCEWTEA